MKGVILFIREYGDVFSYAIATTKVGINFANTLLFETETFTLATLQHFCLSKFILNETK